MRTQEWIRWIRRLKVHEDLPWVILPGLKSLTIDELMCWLPVVVRLVTVRYPRPDRRAQPKNKRKLFLVIQQSYCRNEAKQTPPPRKTDDQDWVTELPDPDLNPASLLITSGLN